jgi:hypothetical protein
MAFVRSRLFYNIPLQALLWGTALSLVVVDLFGGTYVVGVVSTAWGNASVVEVGPRYFGQLFLIILNFSVSLGTMAGAFRRSVSRRYRPQVAVVMTLPPFLLLGVVERILRGAALGPVAADATGDYSQWALL